MYAKYIFCICSKDRKRQRSKMMPIFRQHDIINGIGIGIGSMVCTFCISALLSNWGFVRFVFYQSIYKCVGRDVF